VFGITSAKYPNRFMDNRQVIK